MQQSHSAVPSVERRFDCRITFKQTAGHWGWRRWRFSTCFEVRYFVNYGHRPGLGKGERHVQRSTPPKLAHWTHLTAWSTNPRATPAVRGTHHGRHIPKTIDRKPRHSVAAQRGHRLRPPRRKPSPTPP